MNLLSFHPLVIHFFPQTSTWLGKPAIMIFGLEGLSHVPVLRTAVAATRLSPLSFLSPCQRGTKLGFELQTDSGEQKLSAQWSRQTFDFQTPHQLNVKFIG